MRAVGAKRVRGAAPCPRGVPSRTILLRELRDLVERAARDGGGVRPQQVLARFVLRPVVPPAARGGGVVRAERGAAVLVGGAHALHVVLRDVERGGGRLDEERVVLVARGVLLRLEESVCSGRERVVSENCAELRPELRPELRRIAPSCAVVPKFQKLDSTYLLVHISSKPISRKISRNIDFTFISGWSAPPSGLSPSACRFNGLNG